MEIVMQQNGFKKCFNLTIETIINNPNEKEHTALVDIGKLLLQTSLPQNRKEYRLSQVCEQIKSFVIALGPDGFRNIFPNAFRYNAWMAENRKGSYDYCYIKDDELCAACEGDFAKCQKDYLYQNELHHFLAHLFHQYACGIDVNSRESLFAYSTFEPGLYILAAEAIGETGLAEELIEKVEAYGKAEGLRCKDISAAKRNVRDALKVSITKNFDCEQ